MSNTGGRRRLTSLTSVFTLVGGAPCQYWSYDRDCGRYTSDRQSPGDSLHHQVRLSPLDQGVSPLLMAAGEAWVSSDASGVTYEPSQMQLME